MFFRVLDDATLARIQTQQKQRQEKRPAGQFTYNEYVAVDEPLPNHFRITAFFVAGIFCAERWRRVGVNFCGLGWRDEKGEDNEQDRNSQSRDSEKTEHPP